MTKAKIGETGGGRGNMSKGTKNQKAVDKGSTQSALRRHRSRPNRPQQRQAQMPGSTTRNLAASVGDEISIGNIVLTLVDAYILTNICKLSRVRERQVDNWIFQICQEAGRQGATVAEMVRFM
jgi:hypothetical protein